MHRNFNAPAEAGDLSDSVGSLLTMSVGGKISTNVREFSPRTERFSRQAGRFSDVRTDYSLSNQTTIFARGNLLVQQARRAFKLSGRMRYEKRSDRTRATLFTARSFENRSDVQSVGFVRKGMSSRATDATMHF
jgi:hypothetical protein